MKKQIYAALTVFGLLFLGQQINAQEMDEGPFGYGEVNVRAKDGLLREMQIKKFDFSKTGFKNIALIYWPDSLIGIQKIGYTVFENKTYLQDVSNDFIVYADSLVKSKFGAIEKIKFNPIDIKNKNLKDFFEIRKNGTGVNINTAGILYLGSLNVQGYDGLFLLYEHDLRDLFTKSEKFWLPSKGIFKFYNNELFYSGIYCLLIDLYTGKIVKNIGYQQMSGSFYSGENLKKPETINLNQYLDQIKLRFKINIDEILRVHKLM